MPTESLVPGARSSPASDREIRTAVRRARRAILVVDEAGDVRLANSAAHELFGYAEPQLVGTPTSVLVPGAFRARGAGRRPIERAVLPADSGPITHHARRGDGSRFAVHVSRKPLHFEGAVMILATVQPHSAAPEQHHPEPGPRSTEVAELRRLDDSLLQDLTVALWGLDARDLVSARSLIERAVEQAREMQRILAPAPNPSLSDPSRSEEAAPVIALPAARLGRRPLVRVVLADDTDEIRDALRRYLGRHADVEVVGEAVDGAHAVDVAQALQPDLIVLDYSMPVMDGLEALPRLRAAAPAAKVIMLSSHADAVIGDAAIRGGAIAYVEKGGVSSLKRIVGLIEQHFVVESGS